MQITSGNLHAPCTWPLHVTSPVTYARTLCAAQLNSRSWVDWAPLHDFAESGTFSERRRSLVSARDVSHDFFRSRWASLDQPSVFVTRLTILHIGYKYSMIGQSYPLFSHLAWVTNIDSRLILALQLLATTRFHFSPAFASFTTPDFEAQKWYLM